MPRAYVLINTQPNTEYNVVKSLKALPEVNSADVLFGYYDVIASIDVSHVNQIGQVIDKVRETTEGIDKTSTMIVKDDYFSEAAR